MKVKLTTLLMVVTGVAVVTVLGFTYFYASKKAPKVVETLKAVAGNVAPSTPPKFIANISGKTPETELKMPLSVAVADNGRIFVADTGNSRVQVYDPNGQFLFQFGRANDDPILETPATMAWHKGQVFVGDSRKNSLFVFDESGRLLKSITSKDVGDVFIPLAMAFDGDTLYVASGPGYVYVFNADGKLTSTIAKPGGPDGYLGYPNGIAIMDGKVVVADSNNQRIQVFDKSGNLVSAKKDLSLGLPRGMVVDRFGRLLLVDTFAHEVLALDKDLKLLFRFGTRGLEEGQFNFPNQVATDNAGRLYIADRQNNRIAIFGY